MTRRVRYEVAMSLDGYIAGPKGEFDWIPEDPDIDFGALLGSFDTLVMGRKTWEVARQHGGAGMPGMAAYVISRTLGPADCPDATVSDDPAAVVGQLKAAPGKDIWLFGGGVLFRNMLELGLVDGVEVAVVPIVLGGGIPFLPGPAPATRLRLESHVVYPKSGIVKLGYAVAPSGA